MQILNITSFLHPNTGSLRLLTTGEGQFRGYDGTDMNNFTALNLLVSGSNSSVLRLIKLSGNEIIIISE